MSDAWTERRSKWAQQPDDSRGPYDVDYSRIVHSSSFRRLQGKTQILNLGDSDFYRTRLTHSLEVGQIAGGIVRQLRMSQSAHPGAHFLPDEKLVQAIGFAHDLGHPPFGHGGEVALNYCMRKNGGFEGNGQTLRILSKLESFSEKDGADLCRRTLLGLLKYPAPFSDVKNPRCYPAMDERPTSIRLLDRNKSKPPKCFMDSERDVVDWILTPFSDSDRHSFQAVKSIEGKHSKPTHKSFDCSIMDVADDIAYGVHDLEDAIALGLISERTFRQAITPEKCGPFLYSLMQRYPEKNIDEASAFESFVNGLFGEGGGRKRSIGRLVHYFIVSTRIDTSDGFEDPILSFRAGVPKSDRDFLSALQDLIVAEVITSPNVQHLEFKGQKMVVSVFEAMQSDPRSFLPRDAYKEYVASGEDLRVICDYVAGMTDGYLLKTYDRLFSPRMGSVFDQL
ncbi:MAG: dGTPase [Alphaproteobacteria bacterium]|nr:dGTPase [Alphaproteobacteria bacterium]